MTKSLDMLLFFPKQGVIMRQICFTLFGCICLLIQGFCDDRGDHFYYKNPDQLFQAAVWGGDVESCKALLETGEISDHTIDEMFSIILFDISGLIWPEMPSVSSRIELGKLLAKYLSPDKNSWIGKWVCHKEVYPIVDPEIWKILTSSIPPQCAFYPKCFLINCIVRKQCYETYSDYPRFLDQMFQEYGFMDKESEWSSFLPPLEILEAHIDLCNENNLGFSSKEEISQFIEKTYNPPPRGHINVLFSSFLPMLDDDLGLTLSLTTKTNLLMDFFQHASLETSDFNSYHKELPLLYFTSKFFEKKPLCQLDAKIVVERILAGVDFKQLEKQGITNICELRSIYAWYHLLNTSEVKDYIEQNPDGKKEDYQSKVDMLLNIAREEGCDRGSLLSLITKKFEDQNQLIIKTIRDNLSCFKGGMIDWFSYEENTFTISFTSKKLSRGEVFGIFDDDSNYYNAMKCSLRFLKVEDLQFVVEDKDLKMTIFDLCFDEDNQMNINYFIDGDLNMHVLKVKAEKILYEVSPERL